jgi:NADH dehydrogenase/NADH:ubiquinone oxidoreductase subunit G
MTDLRELLRDLKTWLSPLQADVYFNDRGEPQPKGINPLVRRIDAALAQQPEPVADDEAGKVVAKLTDWKWLCESANEGWDLPKAGTEAMGRLCGRAAGLIERQAAALNKLRQEAQYTAPPSAAALIAEQDAEIEQLRQARGIDAREYQDQQEIINSLQEARWANHHRAEAAEHALAGAKAQALREAADRFDELGGAGYEAFGNTVADELRRMASSQEQPAPGGS